MNDLSVIESVVIGGDLSKLSPADRIMYYKSVCSSLGLNPLTKPFSYIVLNGRMVLYANKDATEQLRKKHNISIEKPDIRFEDDWIIVTVAARDNTGRSDSDVGVVNKKDMRGDFGNALMKAVTKAKRRVTLSICGLGMLDETEIETIPDAKPVPFEIAEATQEPAKMSLETAEAVTSSDGIRYGDIETEKLVHMANALQTSLNKNGLTPEDRETRLFKLDAIKTILANRAKA